MKYSSIFIKNKGFICIAMCAVMLALCGAYIPVKAASNKATKKINSTYGYLRGEMSNGYRTFDGKFVYTFASTDKAVPFIRAYQKVLINSSGKQVDDDTTSWIKNSNYVHAECQLIHADPKGYKNTTLVAYGTCDAIVKDAYAVYMTVKW